MFAYHPHTLQSFKILQVTAIFFSFLDLFFPFHCRRFLLNIFAAWLHRRVSGKINAQWNDPVQNYVSAELIQSLKLWATSVNFACVCHCWILKQKNRHAFSYNQALRVAWKVHRRRKRKYAHEPKRECSIQSVWCWIKRFGVGHWPFVFAFLKV